MNTKKCTECGIKMPLSRFIERSFTRKTKTRGMKTYFWHSGRCRRCFLAVNRELKRAALKRNPDYFKEYSRNHTRKQKLIALTHYSHGVPSCVCCGEKHIEFLCIDHINGGGNTERRLVFGKNTGGRRFYRWLQLNNFPDGYQVLCYNCNMGKEYHGGCPHKNHKGSMSSQ